VDERPKFRAKSEDDRKHSSTHTVDEKLRVRFITPMFSAYVVTPVPPHNPEMRRVSGCRVKFLMTIRLIRISLLWDVFSGGCGGACSGSAHSRQVGKFYPSRPLIRWT